MTSVGAPSGPRSLLRLHPDLLVHTTWLAGRRRLVAQASAARPPLILNDPRALWALSRLPPAFDRDSAGSVWQELGLGARSRDELWAALESAGLLTPAGGQDASWWDEHGWREARTYHHATRDYPFVQMDQPGAFAVDGQRMNDYRDEGAQPAPFQHVGGGDALDLPRPRDGESHDAWLARMSGEDRRAREGVGLLLDVCFGERARIKVTGGGTCLLKSIPSGGARHPLEVFLAAFELGGIDPGVYHYDVEHHRLETVRPGQHRDAFAAASLDLFAKHADPPAAAVVFTSLVERAMWRYRDPRSFRAILVDVGHAMVAYRHVARMLGFRTYAYQKMHDRKIADLVRVDAVAQPPLFIGTLVS